jgi:hypothetical protein
MGLVTLYFTLKLVEVRVSDDESDPEQDCDRSKVKRQDDKQLTKKNDFSIVNTLKKIITYFIESILFLKHHPKATKLMFLNSFVGAVDILLLFFLQTKLKTAGISNVFLGVALFTMELGGVIGSKLILRLKKVKYVYIFMVCTLGVIAGVILEHTGIVLIMILGGFISSLADDAIQIRTDAKLNDMFPSEQRATLVSISSFTFSVIMIVLSPLAGYFFSIW